MAKEAKKDRSTPHKEIAQQILAANALKFDPKSFAVKERRTKNCELFLSQRKGVRL
jgi:hypothetical protein